MFENLFSKNTLKSNSENSPEPLVNEAREGPELNEQQIQEWQQRLEAAKDDETALLGLALEAPLSTLKLVAIESMKEEATLKQIMQEFRERDKRLYRAAKTRWQYLTDIKQTRQNVEALISQGQSLLGLDLIPVNRVVELDQGWAGLQVDIVDPQSVEAFTHLTQALAERVKSQGERVQLLNRWTTAVDTAMHALSEILPRVAQAELPPAEAESLALALLELVPTSPEPQDPRTLQKMDLANRLLATASSLVERAKFLLSLPAEGTVDQPTEKQLIERWRSYPEITDGDMHTALSHRFAAWRNSTIHERGRLEDVSQNSQRDERHELLKQRSEALERDILAAEVAQGAGQLSELTRLMIVIEQGLKRGSVQALLLRRIEELRREHRRLLDWQRWSGSQGREQLASEAQALAEATKLKVNLKSHAETINKLRERWKELDKLGGAAKQSVWLSFDAALEAAYVPVAENLEKLKLARQENLKAREEIIVSLIQAQQTFFPAVVETADSDPAVPQPSLDGRAVAQVLEQTQTAWRKLGPVEHTVPRKMLQGDKAVTVRYANALKALQEPLQLTYEKARNAREQLIQRAKTLAETAATQRDVVDRVRQLQSQWQAVAKSMPLPRRDENSLWLGFKSATDAIFAARDAARAEQQTQLNAKQSARSAVIASLSELKTLNEVAAIKRGMAQAESAWRACESLPKGQESHWESRYRSAREGLTQRVSELTLHLAQARYDALLAGLLICESSAQTLTDTQSAEASLPTLAAESFDGLTDLPNHWKKALLTRAGLSSAAVVLDPSARGTPVLAPKRGPEKSGQEALLDGLLQLEVACGIDSPADFLAARQQLKMRALKNAMEARQTTVVTAADIDRWLMLAVEIKSSDALCLERLQRVIQAMKLRAS